jgi:hypothetical protein
MQYRHQFFQVFCMFPTVPFVLLLMLPILLNQDKTKWMTGIYLYSFWLVTGIWILWIWTDLSNYLFWLKHPGLPVTMLSLSNIDIHQNNPWLLPRLDTNSYVTSSNPWLFYKPFASKNDSVSEVHNTYRGYCIPVEFEWRIHEWYWFGSHLIPAAKLKKDMSRYNTTSCRLLPLPSSLHGCHSSMHILPYLCQPETVDSLPMPNKQSTT